MGVGPAQPSLRPNFAREEIRAGYPNCAAALPLLAPLLLGPLFPAFCYYFFVCLFAFFVCVCVFVFSLLFMCVDLSVSFFFFSIDLCLVFLFHSFVAYITEVVIWVFIFCLYSSVYFSLYLLKR